jgi:CO/xanthine dehydrogenase FAD-binding subunit
VTIDADRRYRAARLALTGVDRGPVLVPEAAMLAGEAADAAPIGLVADAAARRAHPVKNAWGYTVSYRVKVVRPYVERALTQAAARAVGMRGEA